MSAAKPSLQWQGQTLHIAGTWELTHYRTLQEHIVRLQAPRIDTLVINGRQLVTLDTTGALLLKQYIERLGVAPERVTLQDFGADAAHFIQEIWSHKMPPESPEDTRADQTMPSIHNIGRRVSYSIGEMLNLLSFTGQIFVTFGHTMLSPRSFRFTSWVRHMDEAGVRAIPIVSLLAFLISIVLAYQGATQLKTFGADIYTIDLTAISILREMGVLLTAIMVAGRSGSAFAAEIGVMKLREEVDALRTIGLDPMKLLVLPRILALVCMLPALTFIANICGLFGTYIMTYLLMDIPFSQFLDRVYNVVHLNTFMVGMVKAPVFGFLIALVGTYQGRCVSGSAESVGRLTTLSVVQSIFLVILADALFSILFSEFGI